MSRKQAGLTCPSSSPQSEGARVFGVVLRRAEGVKVAYLDEGVPLDDEALQAAGDLSPTRVFRIAGKCVEGACAQFQGGRCRLGATIVERLEAVDQQPPPCVIRPTCRWYAENGVQACHRCSQISTSVGREEGRLAEVALYPERASAVPAME